MNNELDKDLSVQELLKKVFQVNPSAAVDIFLEHLKQDYQWINAIGELREDKHFNLKIIEKLDINDGFFNFFFFSVSTKYTRR